MNTLKRLWRLLVSRTTGIVLLIAVSLALLLGAALPNPALMPPADAERLKAESSLLYWFGDNFNSMKVGRSPVFGVAGLLLVISTGFCSIDRVTKRLKSGRSADAEPAEQGGGRTVDVQNSSGAAQRLIDLLKRDRWKIKLSETKGGSVVSASKGDLGFWGSVFFHAVLITLAAGLVVFYFNGFYATMVFTEGQELTLQKENLSKIERLPALGITLPDLVFRFNRFSTEYQGDTATDYTAEFDVVETRTGKTWNQIFKVNRPFTYGGMEFLINRQGYSSHFVLFKDNVPVFDSFVALNVAAEQEDSFEVPGEGLFVNARFFPDLARRDDGGVYSKSARPRNPSFGLEIMQKGERVFRGLVGKGETISFGPYRLTFADLRHWVTLELVREPGIGFFFVSAMVGLVGLLMRLADPERTITAVIAASGGGEAITFSHSAKHFEGMLQERLDEIIAELKK